MDRKPSTWTGNPVHEQETQNMDRKPNTWTGNPVHGQETQYIDRKSSTWTGKHKNKSKGGLTGPEVI